MLRRLALVALLAAPAAQAGPPTPPATPREPVKGVLHGTELVDEFRWLEGDEQGRLTPRVAEWTDAQNAYTRAVLDANGGLLTGAVAMQRPDLLRAVVSDVPLLDVLRYHRFLMARFWVPEYGTAEDEGQFRFLRAYSPSQQVKPGVAYPAMLFTAGENDTRVHPLHARKMAAALQAATTSDPAERPILLWVDRDAGHGGGEPLSLRIREVADERLFLMWQLGLLPRE